MESIADRQWMVRDGTARGEVRRRSGPAVSQELSESITRRHWLMIPILGSSAVTQANLEVTD